MSEAAKRIRELERAVRKVREDVRAAALEADVAIKREVDLHRKAEKVSSRFFLGPQDFKLGVVLAPESRVYQAHPTPCTSNLKKCR